MNQYNKIKFEIQQIEKELLELRQYTNQAELQSPLSILNLRNERIKSAFKSITPAIAVK